MGRWEPDARGRLVLAARDLYLSRGFDATTVADIARRAGVTERTFFRHFADKREVLFEGGGELLDLLVSALEAAPAEAAPIDAVAAALGTAGEFFEPRREFASWRQRLIAAHPELQERELIKMAGLAAVLADGLRRRGVADMPATLAAEAGIAVFRVAFERWTVEDRSLSELLEETFGELRIVTGGG